MGSSRFDIKRSNALQRFLIKSNTEINSFTCVFQTGFTNYIMIYDISVFQFTFTGSGVFAKVFGRIIYRNMFTCSTEDVFVQVKRWQMIIIQVKLIKKM